MSSKQESETSTKVPPSVVKEKLQKALELLGFPKKDEQPKLQQDVREEVNK